MDRQTSESQHSRAVYGKDQIFDIEVGMAVHGPDGKRIGKVTEVAGFGSTHLPEIVHAETAAIVTQAQSGTGYLKVDRREVVGRRDAAPLCVLFHGVQGVIPGYGVMLNGTIISELRQQAERTAPVKVKEMHTQRGRWHGWVPGRRL